VRTTHCLLPLPDSAAWFHFLYFSPTALVSRAMICANKHSWDRQPYLTKNGVVDGYNASEKMGHEDASIIKAQCHITKNFIINGYNGVWAIDHDDGSQFYNDTSNVMVWGGCKNYLGNSKSCDHNWWVGRKESRDHACGNRTRSPPCSNPNFTPRFF
jgi:hypothetical protein